MNGASRSLAHTYRTERRISQVSVFACAANAFAHSLLKAASNSIHKTSAQTTWLTHQRQATCPIPTPLSTCSLIRTCKLTKRWICIKALLPSKVGGKCTRLSAVMGDAIKSYYIYLAQIGLDSLVSVTWLAPIKNDCIRTKAALKERIPTCVSFSVCWL
jgi:hypothetical protein